MPKNQKQETGAEESGVQNAAVEAIDAAKHHVGRTLESDPEYNEHPAREGAPQAGLIDPHGNDLTASPDLRDAQQRMREDGTTAPEPLKTRLPGDTSSDPHPDLGNVQPSGEERTKRRQR